MKKILLILVAIFCVGCVTIKIPRYVSEESPYKKKFYASYDKTLDATLQALKDLGWRISEKTNPSIFEQDQALETTNAKKILIFTEVRQTPFILSSRYMNLNVYLRSTEDTTEVEIRYVSIIPVLFKNIQSYKNDAVVPKILDRIDMLLKK